MEETAQEAARLAASLFGGEYLCAESVLLAIARTQGKDSEAIPAVASGFCSGVARTCDICGAVSGGIMGLGLCRGKRAPGESPNELYVLVRELEQRFLRRHGSLNCCELIGVDLSTEAGGLAYKERNLYDTCREFVADAARIVAALLDDSARESRD